MIFLKQTIDYFGLLLGIAILLPAVFAWLISYLTNTAGSVISEKFGSHFYLVISSIGVIIHELSHLIMALLFGHHIENFRLLQLPKNGQVGFVTHSANPKNPWQAFGNLLIGFAPMIGNSLTIYLLTRYLQPNVFYLQVSFNWQLLCWLLIVFSLSLGIGLSHEDFENSMQGMWIAILLLIIAALTLQLTHIILIDRLFTFIQQEASLFVIALAIAVIDFLIAKVITFF